MSKLEDKITCKLHEYGIKYERQKPVPIDHWPWKTKQSKISPKCDIFLSSCDIYIEVKGFMTMEAMSKLSFLSRQEFTYYIFQGTEFEWDPSIQSPIQYIQQDSKSKILKANIEHQINELCLINENANFCKNISEISLERLRNFISKRINQYKEWNKTWY